jgi:hypothetical protein
MTDASTIKKAKVFISYSREDIAFADQLVAALEGIGFDPLIDRHSIPGGEDWKTQLRHMIVEADSVVFVLSPRSAASKLCEWEVGEADQLNKRLIPILCASLEGVSVPPRLADLNYIYFYAEPKVSGSGFGSGLARLLEALNTDLDWIKDHTRLGALGGKILHPSMQHVRVHVQVAGRLLDRDPTLPDQLHRLNLELPRISPAIHDTPPVPS